jgi:TetR/AcrR family transcriptional regulator, mexJK operon transcriptional repressor
MSPLDAPLADAPALPTGGAPEAANDAASASPRGRDSRRKAILDIARDTFMEQGYAAASMSAIAAKLGGSKGTLYNYFPSKEELFAAVIQEECGSEWLAMALFEPTDSLEESLRRFGGRFLRYVLSDTALAFHRLISAEGGRFPQLGRTFYDAGPSQTSSRVAGFLRERMAQGVLREGDPQQAAAFLLGLLKANIHHRRVWNVLAPMDEADLDAHVAQAVQVFLHGYATAPAA